MTAVRPTLLSQLLLPVIACSVAACQGGGAGSDGGAAICGTHDPLGPITYVRTSAPSSTLYEGPAIIERSNEQSMVITIPPVVTDGGVPLPARVEVSHLNPMPMLPVGGRVWLSSLLDFRPMSWVSPPWAMSVRNSPGGDLLFGVAKDALDSPAAPVATGARTAVCTMPNPDSCGPGSLVTYQSLEIRGDHTVVINDSATGVVAIGGIDYDVRVGAQQSTQPTRAECGDYFPPNGTSLDVRAHDLAPLAAALAIDPLPVCVEGNESDAAALYAWLNNAANQTYDGPVHFDAQASTTANSLYFSLDNPAAGAVEPMVKISANGPVMLTPAANAEFWFTLHPSGMWVLRGPQRGPVLLANAEASTTDTAELADLATELGVSVTAEQRCAYSSDPARAVQYLFDGVMGTSPPTRITGRNTTLVHIADRDYAVFLLGQGGARFSLAAR